MVPISRGSRSARMVPDLAGRGGAASLALENVPDRPWRNAGAHAKWARQERVHVIIPHHSMTRGWIVRNET